MSHTRDTRSTAMFDVNTEKFPNDYVYSCFIRKSDMNLTCQEYFFVVSLLFFCILHIEPCNVQLVDASNIPQVIESIEATYVAIVFHISLKFASRESCCLNPSKHITLPPDGTVIGES